MFHSKEQDKNKALILLDFVLTFVVLYLSSVAIHEYWHAGMSGLLGLDATVEYTWISGLTYPSSIANFWTTFTVGIGGGVGVGLFYFLIYFLDSDWETTLAAGLIGSMHIGYGCFESLYLTPWVGQTELSIGAVVGVVIFILYRLYRAWKPG